MIFRIFGPYPIKLDAYGNIPASLSELWATVNKTRSGLSDAKGCYVFGISTSGGNQILPWYVGKTTNQVYLSECFKAHQRNHYSRAINHYSRAKPYMYLIPQLTNDGRFFRGTASRAIDFVETYLIGFALWANPDLLNKRDTKLYREIEIPGFLNTKRGTVGAATRALKRSFYFPS